MATQATARRSYGTGRLFEKADSAGRVSWYGKWRNNGTQVKRRIGPKKENGSKHGLTKRQAEAELRRLIREIKPTAPASESMTISELGRRYIEHLQNQGRKKSTQAAVERVERRRGTTSVWPPRLLLTRRHPAALKQPPDARKRLPQTQRFWPCRSTVFESSLPAWSRADDEEEVLADGSCGRVRAVLSGPAWPACFS
jgi:hypothetical protein